MLLLVSTTKPAKGDGNWGVQISQSLDFFESWSTVDGLVDIHWTEVENSPYM
jgi:hypothetical protein